MKQLSIESAMHQNCTDHIQLSICPETLKYETPYVTRIKTGHPMEQFLPQRTLTRLQSLAA